MSFPQEKLKVTTGGSEIIKKIGNPIFFGQKPQRFLKFCIIRFVITEVESFICGIIELTISSIIEFSYFSIEDTLGAP